MKKLTSKQAKSILNEMYYQNYRINYVPNLLLARVTFDHCVNGGPKLNKNLYAAVNEVLGTDLTPSKVISNDLADKIATLTKDEALLVRDKMVEKKMEFHFERIDQRHDQINNLDGWYERAKSQYSDKDNFDGMFAQKRLKYFDKYFSLLKEERTRMRIKKELERTKK